MFSPWLPPGCWDPQLWCTTEQREKAVGLEDLPPRGRQRGWRLPASTRSSVGRPQSRLCTSALGSATPCPPALLFPWGFSPW